MDIAPIDDSDPVAEVKAIIKELGKIDAELLAKERWLVLK